MKATVTFELGELAYMKDVIAGRHPADFWSYESRTKLEAKLQKAIDDRLSKR